MCVTIIVPLEMVPQMVDIRLWKWLIEVLIIYDKVIAQHIEQVFAVYKNG